LDKDCCFFLAKVAQASSARDAFRSWHDFCMKHEVQLDAERNIRAKDFDEKMKVLDLMLDFPDNPLLETLRKQLPIDMIEKLVEQNNKEKKEKNTAEKPGFFDLYNQLCQLQRPQSSLLPPEERCVLYTTHPTADALAPFKLEFHSYNPLVATVHDVISDRKIDELVSVASSRLETPKTISASDAAIHSRSGSRTGKVAFMQPREYKQVRAMAGKLTGLNLDLAEPLQLVAYGIGGQYEPHRDYFGSAAIRTPESGDRVATLLFYLNNVTEGGATVFPALGLAIHPQRGSALFWYNLFKNGEGDESTMHAGCPVLIGSKWIANQWFRERGQEFSRPCDLERDL
jgi:prolyl 4-hydroxylase